MAKVLTNDGQRLEIEEALDKGLKIDWKATYEDLSGCELKPTLEDRVEALEKEVASLRALIKEHIWQPIYDRVYGGKEQ